MNLNKVFVLGRLTADPQLRATTGGMQVGSFGLATNRVWINKGGEKQEATEFHNIVVWGKQAEVASRFLTKGSLVLIEGRLQSRSWDDKQGQRRKTTEIVAERMQLGPRPGGAPNAGRGSEPAPGVDQSLTGGVKEEIPTIDVDEEVKSEDLPF
jgi:single-strand DNA-binding protein